MVIKGSQFLQIWVCFQSVQESVNVSSLNKQASVNWLLVKFGISDRKVEIKYGSCGKKIVAIKSNVKELTYLLSKNAFFILSRIGFCSRSKTFSKSIFLLKQEKKKKSYFT